jgi:hypothetical protein
MNDRRLFYPPHPSFDQQLEVGGAGLVRLEAMPECVLKMPHLKTRGTPGVITVEKRAMSNQRRHKSASGAV